MKKSVFSISICIFLSSLSILAPTTSAQNIFPAVSVDCDVDVIEIIDYSYTSHNTFCTIENPTVYSEEIKLVALGNGTAINGVPESITLAAGESMNIDIEINTEGFGGALGIRNISINAEVTQAAGIPAGIFGAEDSAIISLDFLEYLEIYIREVQGGGQYDEGEEIVISIPEDQIEIWTNKDSSIYLRAHLIEENKNSNDPYYPLPEEFEFSQGTYNSCRYIITNSDDTCSWTVLTPEDIDEDWKGCAVVYVITSWDSPGSPTFDENANFDLAEMPTSCNTNVYGAEVVDISIEKDKGVENLISIGGNDSFIGQLGITEDQLPIIGGSILIIFTILIALVIIRRR
ncbi:MAG: hypothetical protein CL993_04605 [Euryarchaeota archaeon]|nr:hypothetical protein [Euryarchaeota archaeon]